MKVGTWISTGNEADITLAECLEYLVDSDSVDTIACYMEAVNDRDRFFHALEKARTNRKLVTIIKVGTSAAGAEAAQSHTASLAGSDESFEAVLHHFGIPRARTTEEMLDIIYAANLSPLPKGRKLGILTVSGGAGVLMADAAEAAGLTTPPLPGEAQQRLKTRNPLSSPRNPIDITAHALNDFALVSENLASMLVDGGYDMLISFFTSWTASPLLGPKVQKSILDGLAGQPNKPVVVVCQGSDAVMASYEAHDLMVFEDPSRAIRALGHLADFAEAASAGRTDPADLPVLPANVTLPAEQVGEQRAKQILAAAGIGILPEEITATPNAAAEAATRIGFPVALKIVSPDIQHKTEVGGVALGLADADAVRTEAANMLTRVHNKMPDARIDGLLVTSMASEGIELVVGVRNDRVMGPMVMVGLGGIFVEIFKDVVLDIAPVTPTEARRMVERLKGAPLLHGARGRRVVDIDAVADAVSRLSVLAARQPGAFDSIEINPLLARAHGAVALDALIVPARKPGVMQETAA